MKPGPAISLRVSLLVRAGWTGCMLLFLLSQGGPASAGEPGEGGRPGPGFGGPPEFRGPGLPGLGTAQDSIVALLEMQEVRKELAASEEQGKKLDEILTRARTEMRSSFERIDFQELWDLDDEEREKRFAEARKGAEEAEKSAEKACREVLDAGQARRLAELRLQRSGAAALDRDDTAKALGLTDEQRQAIRKALEESGASRGGPGGGPFSGPFGPPSGPGGPGGSRAEREPAQAKLLSVLNPEQLEAWNTMKGKAFQFPEPRGGFGRGGPGFPGGPGGPGFPGGPGGGERKLVKEFDKDGNGWLSGEERKAARESLGSNRNPGGPGGFGPRGGLGPGSGREAPKPGARVQPGDVPSYPDSGLYEPSVLRTLFLEFEEQDWEAELADFHGTDVDVPATLTVDGKKYPNVGIRFRGMSSYMMVSAGYKRSLNVSVDIADPEARLYGYKTLNLLNFHEDASLMNTVLYSLIARQFIPAPRANFVKVVINGESWGLYANVQQINKEFVQENFKSSKGGARWKVRGSPGADGGLGYVGEDVAEYKRRYEIKSSDSADAWKALIGLCKTIEETPSDKLEAALEPILDVDGLLWFLALDVALVNGDGYWARASDYHLFLDSKGKFHVIPYDMNESFRSAGGPGFGGPGGGPGFGGPGGFGRGGRGMRGGRGGPHQAGGPGDLAGPAPAEDRGFRPGGPGGDRGEPTDRPEGPPGFGSQAFDLDPLVALDDSRKPLRSKILAVPALRARYLQHMRTLAEEWLDWKKLGPIVARYRSSIEKEVEADTRKLDSFDEFLRLTADAPEAGESRGRRGQSGLRAFADGRRSFLLAHPEIQKAAAASPSGESAAP